MSTPTIDQVDDSRLVQLLDLLRLREGFCNNAIMADEVKSMALELLRYRGKELHCPGCDGDHLYRYITPEAKMSTQNKIQPLVMSLTPEQRAARAPLLDAGNRILSLLYRCGDQITDEQSVEHYRQHSALCRIWNDALVEPIV